jgi:hypothetical protein
LNQQRAGFPRPFLFGSYNRVSEIIKLNQGPSAGPGSRTAALAKKTGRVSGLIDATIIIRFLNKLGWRIKENTKSADLTIESHP